MSQNSTPDDPDQALRDRLADEVAAAASLIMGQAGEGRPIVVARGIARGRNEGSAAELIREPAMDLFP